MKRTDKYHRWVEWSDADQTYLGKCPDLFLGGCHSDDPVECAKLLQSIIDEWDDQLTELPPVKTRPMTEVA